LYDTFVAVLVAALIVPSGLSVRRAAVFGAPDAPVSTIERAQPDATPVAESAALRLQQVRAAARSGVAPSVVVRDRLALPSVRRLGSVDVRRHRTTFASSSARLAVRGPPSSR
jgi:hypothetical protein